MTNVTPIITAVPMPQENQVVKTYFDRLVNLYIDLENLKADIKDVAESAKHSGMDAAAMKKLASLSVRYKLKKARADVSRLENMARMCGQLDFFDEFDELN